MQTFGAMQCVLERRVERSQHDRWALVPSLGMSQVVRGLRSRCPLR